MKTEVLFDTIANIGEKAIEQGREDIEQMMYGVYKAVDQHAGTEDKDALMLDSIFLARMAYRLLNVDRSDSPALNAVYIQENGLGKTYRIVNYSYDMYLWAAKHGLRDYVDNYVIAIPEDKLTDKMKAQLEKKMESQ